MFKELTSFIGSKVREVFLNAKTADITHLVSAIIGITTALSGWRNYTSRSTATFMMVVTHVASALYALASLAGWKTTFDISCLTPEVVTHHFTETCPQSTQTDAPNLPRMFPPSANPYDDVLDFDNISWTPESMEHLPRLIAVGMGLLYSTISVIALGRGHDIRAINSIFTLKSNIKESFRESKDIVDFIVNDVIDMDLNGSKGTATHMQALLTEGDYYESATIPEIITDGRVNMMRDFVARVAAVLVHTPQPQRDGPPIASLVRATHARLVDKLKLVQQRVKSMDVFIDPVGIQLTGPPGVGKTSLAHYIGRHLYNRIWPNAPSKSVYAVNLPANKHWPPYSGQKVMVADEIGKTANDPILMEATGMFSSGFYGMSGAAVEDKFQPREWEVGFIISNLPRPELPDLSPASVDALWSRFTTYDITDPDADAEDRYAGGHRRPDFGHLRIVEKSYARGPGGANYVETTVGRRSVEQVITSIVEKHRQRMIRLEEVRQGDLAPPPAGPVRVGPARFAVPPVLRLEGAAPLVAHLNGPPFEHKTRLLEDRLIPYFESFKLPIIRVTLDVPPIDSAAVYIIDDAIDQSDWRPFMEWFNKVNPMSCVLIASNIRISFKGMSLAQRAFGAVMRGSPYKTAVLPPAGAFAGVARRLGLSGNVWFPDYGNVVTPHGNVFVRMHGGPQLWNGRELTQVSEDELLEHINDRWIAHATGGGNTVVKRVDALPQFDPDIAIVADTLDHLVEDIKSPVSLFRGYCRPNNRLSVTVSSRVQKQSVSGLDHWVYNGVVRTADDLIPLLKTYHAKLQSIGTGMCAHVVAGTNHLLVLGNVIYVCATTTAPVVVHDGFWEIAGFMLDMDTACALLAGDPKVLPIPQRAAIYRLLMSNPELEPIRREFASRMAAGERKLWFAQFAKKLADAPWVKILAATAAIAVTIGAIVKLFPTGYLPVRADLARMEATASLQGKTYSNVEQMLNDAYVNPDDRLKAPTEYPVVCELIEATFMPEIIVTAESKKTVKPRIFSRRKKMNDEEYEAYLTKLANDDDFPMSYSDRIHYKNEYLELAAEGPVSYKAYLKRISKGAPADAHAESLKPGTNQPNAFDSIVAKLRKASVAVIGVNGNVRGFHTHDNYIITVAHAIYADQTNVTVASNEYTGSAEIVYINSDRDVALLKIPGAPLWPKMIDYIAEVPETAVEVGIQLPRITEPVAYGMAHYIPQRAVKFDDSWTDAPLMRKESYEINWNTGVDNVLPSDGDCGTAYITVSKHFAPQIIALHCGRYNGFPISTATSITRGLIMSMVPSERPQGNAQKVGQFLVDEATSELLAKRKPLTVLPTPVIARWAKRTGTTMDWKFEPRYKAAIDWTSDKVPLQTDADLLNAQGYPQLLRRDGTYSLAGTLALKFKRERKAPPLKDLLDTVDHMVRYYKDRLMGAHRLTFNEVVFGLKPTHPHYSNFSPASMDTNAGVYYQTKYGIQRKADFFHPPGDGFRSEDTVKHHEAWADLKARVQRIATLAKHGTPIMCIHKACVKDELLKPSKGLTGDGRLFYACDWALNIWLNMTYGGLWAIMRALHREMPWGIGQNVELEFDEMMVKAKSYNLTHAMTVDAANWDISQHPDVIRATQRFESEICALSPTYSNAEDCAKEGLAAALYRSTSFILVDDCVTEVDGIACSGIAGTTERNCLNHILMYYHEWRLRFPSKNPIHQFHKNVFLKVYGDDVWASIRPGVDFTGEMISAMYASFGIVATDSTKTGPPRELPFDENSYCSRFPKFYKEFGTHLPALKKITVDSMFVWMTSSDEDAHSTKVKQALISAIAWGFEYFEKMQSAALTWSAKTPRRVVYEDDWFVLAEYLANVMRGRVTLTPEEFTKQRQSFFQNKKPDNQLIARAQSAPLEETNCQKQDEIEIIMQNPIPHNVILARYCRNGAWKLPSKTQGEKNIMSDEATVKAIFHDGLILTRKEEKFRMKSWDGMTFVIAPHDVDIQPMIAEATYPTVSINAQIRNDAEEDNKTRLRTFLAYHDTALTLIAYRAHVYKYGITGRKWNFPTGDLVEDITMHAFTDPEEIKTFVNRQIEAHRRFLEPIQATERKEMERAPPPKKGLAPKPPVAPGAGMLSVPATDIPPQAGLPTQAQSLVQDPLADNITGVSTSIVPSNVLQASLVPSIGAAQGILGNVMTDASKEYDLSDGVIVIDSERPEGTVLFKYSYGLGALSAEARRWIDQHEIWMGDIDITVIVAGSGFTTGMFIVGVLPYRFDGDFISPKEMQRFQPVYIPASAASTNKFTLQDTRDTRLWRSTKIEDEKEWNDFTQTLVGAIYQPLKAQAVDQTRVTMRLRSQWLGGVYRQKPYVAPNNPDRIEGKTLGELTGNLGRVRMFTDGNLTTPAPSPGFASNEQCTPVWVKAELTNVPQPFDNLRTYNWWTSYNSEALAWSMPYMGSLTTALGSLATFEDIAGGLHANTGANVVSSNALSADLAPAQTIQYYKDAANAASAEYPVRYWRYGGSSSSHCGYTIAGPTGDYSAYTVRPSYPLNSSILKCSNRNTASLATDRALLRFSPEIPTTVASVASQDLQTVPWTKQETVLLSKFVEPVSFQILDTFGNVAATAAYNQGVISVNGTKYGFRSGDVTDYVVRNVAPFQGGALPTTTFSNSRIPAPVTRDDLYDFLWRSEYTVDEIDGEFHLIGEPELVMGRDVLWGELKRKFRAAKDAAHPNRLQCWTSEGYVYVQRTPIRVEHREAASATLMKGLGAGLTAVGDSASGFITQGWQYRHEKEMLGLKTNAAKQMVVANGKMGMALQVSQGIVRTYGTLAAQNNAMQNKLNYYVATNNYANPSTAYAGTQTNEGSPYADAGTQYESTFAEAGTDTDSLADEPIQLDRDDEATEWANTTMA